MKFKNCNFYSLILIFVFLVSSCGKGSGDGVIKQDPPPPTPPPTTTPDKPKFVTNPVNLNIIMFVPNDNPALPDYKQRLTELFTHFQNWLHIEMLRYGYDAYLGLQVDNATKLVKFIEIKGSRGQASYNYDDGASLILNEIAAYKNTHPEEFSSQSHSLILLPERKDGNNSQPFFGLGKNCFALDNANMAVNKIPNATSNYIGGMLHELGHGLNLPHDRATITNAGKWGMSLMDAGNVSFSKGQATFLTEVDAAILYRNEVFQSTKPSYVAYETSTNTFNMNATYNSTTKSIIFTGSYAASKPVTELLVYMDPNVNNEGEGANTDYNAVSFKYNIATDNTFSITVPVTELQYTNDEIPYQVRFKLLHQNGSTSTFAYPLNFKSGVPDFSGSKVTVTQHCSYGGYNVNFGVGSYKTADLIAAGVLDNDVSGVKIPLGLKVTLYSNDNFTGDSKVITSSQSCLQSINFNDQTSSMVVSVN